HRGAPRGSHPEGRQAPSVARHPGRCVDRRLLPGLMMAVRYAAGVVIAVVLCSSCAARSGATAVTPPPGGVVVRFGSHAVSAELAVTEPQRERGLMFRRHVGSGAGMLFLMAHSERTGFWMKNTLVPLSIAYMRREAPGRF